MMENKIRVKCVMVDIRYGLFTKYFTLCLPLNCTSKLVANCVSVASIMVRSPN